MKAIQITEPGGPEALELVDVATPEIPDGSVLVDVSVSGINFIDTYYREGVYYASLPHILGHEGVGTVARDPRGELATGTRVAWAMLPGSYAEQVALPRERLVEVPDGIDDDTAASMLLQGMTAHFLTHSTYALSEGDSCLITAGAGGVGLLLTQMASALGARVYSVVSSDEKEALAYEAGATKVFRYSDTLAESVRRHNDGAGVDVVYDGVGQATFEESLEAVRPRGLVCLFGAASGQVEPIDPQVLNTHGSIYLTRPSLSAYTATTAEYQNRAQAVIDAVADGTITIRISGAYPMADVARAHEDLEGRRTTGSIVLRIRE